MEVGEEHNCYKRAKSFLSPTSLREREEREREREREERENLNDCFTLQKYFQEEKEETIFMDFPNFFPAFFTQIVSLTY